MADFKQFILDHITPEYRGANSLEYDGNGAEVYLSFQVLLKFISENLNLVSTGDKEIVAVDWQSDKPFYALSCHISTDLTKCYLYNDKLKLEDGITNSSTGISTFHPVFHFVNDDFKALNSNLRSESGATSEDFVYPQIGNINYIYLNIGHLSKVIADNLDKDNKISLRDFLQTVCDDVNKALGGINDLQVVVNVDESPNTLTIVDFNQSRIKGLTSTLNTSPQYTLIQAHGVGIDNGGQATFVKSIQAQSNITPEIASSISIGAQANGNQIGEEATSFSRLSKGLIDRIYPEKYITGSNSSPTLSIPERFSSNIETFRFLIENIKKSENPISSYITLSEEDNNGPAISDLFKALVGEFTEKNISNPTFIPVKLNLELLGISGIRIFEQFELSSDVLPLSYQKDFNFIITGVSHEVDTNKWTTKLAALTYLKELPVSSSAEVKAVNLGLISGNIATSTPPPVQPSNNAIDACVASTPTKVGRYNNRGKEFTVTSALKRKGTATDITKSNGEFHGGMDISVPLKTPIRFAQPATFKEKRNSSTYGNLIILTLSSGFDVYFAHLDSFSNELNKLKKGDKISDSIILGYTGNTGNSTGPHLHFEVRNPKGTQLCPNNNSKFLILD